ncbi:MAG: HupE/UreJ family protein [Cyclobacteriaceae bacterium]|nr:HupE/UreJ family protein [Cyclobacteriaceae bacterium]
MSSFELYFGLGKDHILDYANGYDHILFVLALCAVYLVQDWKKILILVTAFTVGHSVTLALATLDIVTVSSAWVEFLIPVTIFSTAVSNLFRREDQLPGRGVQASYFLALFFGLIHGLGFSNYLKSLLGRQESITMPLFAFNVGLEVGQIIIVGLFLAVSFIAVNLADANRRDWKMIISSAVAGIALMLMKDRIPGL